jgi:hypothetical protein
MSMITNHESALGGRPMSDGLAPVTQSSALAITLIEPSRGWVLWKVRERWEYSGGSPQPVRECPTSFEAPSHGFVMPSAAVNRHKAS